MNPILPPGTQGGSPPRSPAPVDQSNLPLFLYRFLYDGPAGGLGGTLSPLERPIPPSGYLPRGAVEIVSLPPRGLPPELAAAVAAVAELGAGSGRTMFPQWKSDP